MKTVFVQADGLASAPHQELDGRTPLQVASTPNLDFLCSHGEYGHLALPGEVNHFLGDVIHLALLGYDPNKYYSGLGPFEAASLEIGLEKQDVAFLCHLVTIRSDEEKNETKKLGSHFILDDDQVRGIELEDARELIDAINDQMASESIQFYTGHGHRHVMVWAGGMARLACGNPHAALGNSIEPYLPAGEGAEIVTELMEASRIVLRNHPVNQDRQEAGLKPANCLWIWGPGKAVDLPKMSERWSISGATISPVDLHLGIGVCAGLEPINLSGSDGFDPKDLSVYPRICCQALQTKDFVYIHVPTLSRAGEINAQEWVKRVEAFDEGVVGSLIKSLTEFGEYRLFVTCTHPGQENRTHSMPPPAPFASYRTGESKSAETSLAFNEVEAGKRSGRDATRVAERLMASD